ncbi:MAG: PorV/PorQ family protein [Marinifilaceae bacterium]
MNKVISLLLLLFSVSFLHAQTSAPTYSNEFLTIGIGGRAFGMGNATVASARDIQSAYWNPANLVELEKKFDLSLMHADYFAGMAAYDYAGFGMKINEESSFGVSLIRFGVDDIPNTLELVDKDGNIRYDRVKNFSAADYAFLFSYARKTSIEGLQVGGSVKIIYRHTGDFASAYGFGIDAAATYKTGKYRIGAVLRDATSTFNAWVFNTDDLEEVFEMTGNEIPENSTELTLPRLILGLSRDFQLSEKIGLMAELDTDITFDGKRHVLVEGDPVSIDPHFGIEARYTNLVYLRAGVGRIQRETDFDKEENITFQPNLGLGIQYRNFRLDYALTDLGDQSAARYSNVFSLSYSFD